MSGAAAVSGAAILHNLELRSRDRWRLARFYASVTEMDARGLSEGRSHAEPSLSRVKTAMSQRPMVSQRS